MNTILKCLRAAAEPTRLRILALCGHGELSVKELVNILGQSQPRVSRHLKLLDDAGLLERNREGSRAFYRLVGDGIQGNFAAMLIDMMSEDEEILAADLTRLSKTKATRVRRADEYFRLNASKWEDLRNLYVNDCELDKRLQELLANSLDTVLLDIGTGTGRILSIANPYVRSAIGVDNSTTMLSIARANIDKDSLKNCRVQHADMYCLPFPDNRFDIVCANMVIRYADEPDMVLAEGARVLKPGGQLIIVDFAPHELQELRDEHAHQWLGFSEQEMNRWISAANLETVKPEYLEGDPLTVCIWNVIKPNKNLASLLSDSTMMGK